MNTERYQRQLVLPDFGKKGQQKLADAKVLVVGAGGLGVPVLQYLTGMGIGAITIVDGDDITLSNLQRQVMYSTGDVGKKKVEVAKEVLQRLNPETTIEAITSMLSSENADQLIKDHQVVIDCTDNIESRYLINDSCMKFKTPFVYGALYRHEGHVSVFNHKKNFNYRDVYPDDSAKVENCNEIGVLGMLPGMIGCYQAMEAVKIIAEIGETLEGKLLVIDALNTDHHIFELVKTDAKSNVKEEENPLEESWISWEELNELNPSSYHLLDVRPSNVYESFHDPRFESMPMELLPGFVPEKSKEIILVCQKGITTRLASAILKTEFPDTTVHQLKGGYDANE